MQSAVEIPILAFDHKLILNAATERMRLKVEYTSLPAYLLIEPFTIPQLQQVYEIVLGRPVDKSGFRTRALAANFLQEVGVMNVGAPRPASVYKIKDRSRVTYFPRSLMQKQA